MEPNHQFTLDEADKIMRNLQKEVDRLKAERPSLVKKGFQIARNESFIFGSWDSDSYAEIDWESAETALEKELTAMRDKDQE